MPEPAERPEALSLALVTFNQLGVLEKVLSGWSASLEKLGREYEILLVDDGSTDDTAERLDPLAARFPSVTVLRHPEHRGFGAALRTALEKARFPLVFYTTTDYPYPTGDLKTFLEKLEEAEPETGRKPDLITGFRADRPAPGVVRAIGAAWRAVLRVGFGIPIEPLPAWPGGRAYAYAWFTRLFFGVRVIDVNSAFKLVRRTALERAPIQSDGTFAHAELIGKLNFLGCLMDEVPIKPKTGAFPATPVPAEPLGRVLREARRVFGRPNFRPPPQPQLPPAVEPSPPPNPV